MKVKIGNTIYDAEDEPIMVILSESDKKNITNMHPDCTKYCQYPEQHSEQEIEAFMGTDQQPKKASKTKEWVKTLIKP